MNFFKIISALFHPLLMPLYFFALLFINLGIFNFSINGLLYFALFIFFTLVALPAFAILFLKKFSMIEHIDLPSKRDSFIILILMLTFYLFNLRMWYVKNPDTIYLYLFGILGLISGILLIFNFFYPLNSHTTAWGALLGFYLILLKIGASFSFPILSIIILAAGISAVARLYIEQKSSFPLYLGYLAGFISAYVLGLILVVY